MAFKKPSATMIRALLVGLTRRLRTPDGYAYQADADRWPTIQALKERGMIVMETREIIGASGARFQCTGAWLTEEGVTYLREVLEAAMRFAPEDRPEPYRTWLAEDDNADKAAAFLLGDDVAEVHTVTTTSAEQLPHRETLNTRDGIAQFGSAIRGAQRIARECRGGFTATTAPGSRTTFVPVAEPVDVQDVTRKFLDTMESITRTNNTSGLADSMHYISRELWPVIITHKLAPHNAAFILIMDQASTTTHLATLADLGRRASEIWEALIQKELQRRAAAGKLGDSATYEDVAKARKALLAPEEVSSEPNAEEPQERPSRYTVTEEFRNDRTAVWTARVGRTVAVTVECPQQHGMWDTDVLRKALAEHAGVDTEHVRPVRARSEIAVAPHTWEVDLPEADMLPLDAPTEAVEEQHDRAEEIRQEVTADAERKPCPGCGAEAGEPCEPMSMCEAAREDVVSERLAAEGHGYTWGDAREALAADLRIGDVFVKPDTGAAYYVAQDGTVRGAGIAHQMPMDGTAWTVADRMGSAVFAISHDGDMQTADIPDRARVLRVAQGPQDTAPVLTREPWRGGQICGHQTSYGTGGASEFCGRFKALGKRLCAQHNEETGEEIARWAPGNAEGLTLVRTVWGWSVFDQHGDLCSSSDDRAEQERDYGFALLWEPQEGTEPVEPTEEERAMFAAATTAPDDFERQAAELLGNGEEWMRRFCQFGQEPRIERVDRATAVELIVWALRHGGWQVYRADEGGVNLESPTGESSYRLYRPAPKGERVDVNTLVPGDEFVTRCGWTVLAADGWTFTAVSNEGQEVTQTVAEGTQVLRTRRAADGAPGALPFRTVTRGTAARVFTQEDARVNQCERCGGHGFLARDWNDRQAPALCIACHESGATQQADGGHQCEDWCGLGTDHDGLCAPGDAGEDEEATPVDEMGTDELLPLLREEAAKLPAGSLFARAWAALDETLTNGGIECLPAPWDGYGETHVPEDADADTRASLTARFMPQNPHGENTRPYVEIAGALVFVYRKGGRLVVSVDVDTAEDTRDDADRTVPMVITVQGREVYEG